MKLFLLGLMLISINCSLKAQSSIKCATNETTSSHYEIPNNNGVYLTAHDSLNILVVFMRFEDDNLDNNLWEQGQDPKDSLMSIITPKDEVIDKDLNKNISSYFALMSDDKFIVTGDAISIEVDSIDNLNSRKEVAIDVFTNHIDTMSSINLSDYDNWTFDNSGNGNHVDTADGLVDMAVLIYKEAGNISILQGHDGVARLANSDSIIYSQGLGIGLEYPGDGVASGVIVKYGGIEKTFYLTVHEIAHWLFRPHPYKEYGDYGGNYSIHSFMGVDWNPRVTNAYERELMGWIDVPEVTGSETYTLSDYLTTGDALKVKLDPVSNSDNYLYIENHQKVNTSYDIPTDNASEKGLFMFSRDGHYSGDNVIVSESAFGRWDWKQDVPLIESTFHAGESTYVREELSPNPLTGLNNRERRNHDESGHRKLFLAYNDNGTTVTARFDRGEYLGNMFSRGYKSYYSKITNPAPLTFTGGSEQVEDLAYSNISVQILSEQPNGDVVLRVETNHNPYIISEDVTWRGEIFLDNDVTVQSGAKLSVKDATVYVGDNVDITIEGELYTNNATFTAKNNRWDYITFESGSEGSINETVIEKGQAYGGAAVRIVDNQNNIEINESTIQNFSGACGGISASNSSSVYIYRTAFSNLTGDPIKAHNSIIYALENNIEASGYQSGVYANSFSDVTFSGTSYGYYKGKNTITGGKYGIESAYMSDLNAGSTPYFGNENRIMNQLPHNNDWAHIYASHSTATIYAEYNYWKPYNNSGGGSPVTKGTGTIYATNYLTSDPGPALKHVATPPASGEETKPHVEVIAAAKQLMHEGNYTEARKTLEDAFTQFTREQPTLELLKTYVTLAKKDKSASDYVKNIRELTKTVSPKVTPYVYMALATLNKHQNEYNSAEKVLASVIENYPDSDHAFHAHILSAFTWLHLDNINKAESHLQSAIAYNKNQIAGERPALPEESRYASAISHAQFAVHRAQEKRAAKNGTGSFSEPGGGDSSADKKDVTAQNHPNPFNPATTISFSIPERSHVQLVVYDLLGRKVATLASRNFTAGDHSVRFNASALASGIYFYHLKTENHNLVKQMTLIK